MDTTLNKVSAVHPVIISEATPAPSPQSSPIHQAAEGPLVLDEEVHSAVQEDHCYGVIEESQHQDGVHTVGGTAHHKQHIWWHLGQEDGFVKDTRKHISTLHTRLFGN